MGSSKNNCPHSEFGHIIGYGYFRHGGDNARSKGMICNLYNHCNGKRNNRLESKIKITA